MKYQEKTAIASDAVNAISNGETLDAFLAALSNKNIYAADITSIRVIVKKELQKKYGDQFQELLLNDQQASFQTAFPDLAEESIELIKELQIDEIKKSGKRSVAELMKTAGTENEIIEALENRYFSQEEISLEIDNYLRDTPIISKQDKQNNIVKSVLLIGVGVALLLFQSTLGLSGLKTMCIFIGLLIAGVVYYMKSR